MSHTNHKRLKDKVRRDGNRYKASPPDGAGQKSAYSDVLVTTGFGYENSNGHRGYAKAKRGAKKFVRTRIRFQDQQTVNRELRTLR